jgi:predicted NUDIX family NTP pyrophosphohydrolase
MTVRECSAAAGLPKPGLPTRELTVPQPHSAGILLFRRRGGIVEVLLIHPGGPYWAKRDVGAWMIPKGGVHDGEQPEQAALREFAEELGTPLDATPVPLCQVKQSGGKIVDAFVAEGDFDPRQLNSTDFEMEWPRRSGRIERFPEADRARWMTLGEARRMMLESQLPMLDALELKLKDAK